MSTPDAGKNERVFLRAAARRLAGAAGYGEPAERRRTDEAVREHVAGALSGMAGKVGEMRAAADEDGDAEMSEDLQRLEERFHRTASSIRTLGAAETAFLDRAGVEGEALEALYANDAAMLEDLDLLGNDMAPLKFETIGGLTLREVEGTLASIELKVNNRRHLLGGLVE